MVEQPPGERREQMITISTGTIFRIVFVLLILAFLYFIRDILAVFLAGLFLAALIDPFADFFERYRIPRGLAVVIVYIIGLSVVVGAVVLLLPPVLEEVRTFPEIFSTLTGGEVSLGFFEEGGITEGIQNIFTTIRASGFSDAVPQIVEIGSITFQGVLATLLVLILAFYLVVEKSALVRAIAFLTPPEYQPFVLQVAVKVRERLGAWLRGQLILMFSIFLLTYVALTILGIPYALILAILAGVLEAIPFVGPLFSGIPAVIFALAISPFHALATIAAYVMVQSIEGNILVPKIMQRVTGINPIISLLAVLIGWRVGGIVGVLLSIPLANAVAVFAGEVFRKNQEVPSNLEARQTGEPRT